MENIFGDLNTIAPVFLLFVTSGLIIYAVSSWIGEALIGQIKDSKTSLFGRSEDYVRAKSRTIYVPPSQLSTYQTSSSKTTEAAKTTPMLPAIPTRPKIH